MKKILILGGAGFVGYNLATHLKNIGHEVTVCDNLVRRGSELSLARLRKQKINFVHCDIRNKEDYNNLPRVDIVLNCAAQPSAINYDNPEFDITNNTIGVLNTLEWCRKNQTMLIFWSTNKCYSGDIVNSVPKEISNKRFIWNNATFKLNGWSMAGFNESLTVDGSDHSIYGVSKISADLLVQEWSNAYGIPSICNSFSCLAGPYQWGKSEQGWVSWFAIANELELPISIIGFDGYQVRDCLFSDDLNNLITLQIQNLERYKGEVFQVGGGILNTVSINEAIDLLSSNKKWTKINNIKEQRRADQAIYISDITKVQNAFSWSPKVDIQSGYQRILDWVKTNKEELKYLYE